MPVNTNTYTSMADFLTAEALDAEFVLLLAERNNLPMHPAIYMCEPVDASGSATRKVSHSGMIGYDLLTAAGDGAIAGLTSFADGSTTVTAARWFKAYSWTDLARMTMPDGRINPMLLAADAVASANGRVTDLICDVVDGFTATAGPGTGADLTVAATLGAIGAGAVNNFTGPAFMGVLHGQQWSDLIVDGGTSIGSGNGGTQQYNPQLAAMQTLQGDGFVGNWLGVDWFRNNRVKTYNAGADRGGAIFAYGGVMVVEGLMSAIVEDPVNQVLIGGDPSNGIAARVLLERSRDMFAGETAFGMTAYLGASLGIQAGLTLFSDA